MTTNVMEEYLSITKEYIIKYMKLVMQSKYNKEVCERLISKYIETRYNNYYEDEVEKGMSIRKRIMEELKQAANRLIENDIDKKENVDNMCIFFYYILYFDNLISAKNITSEIYNIHKLRKKLLNKDEEDFSENLKQTILNWQEDIKNLLERYETKEFELKISTYKNTKNVYRVNLNYNIRFPQIYSTLAINKAFNTGIINEDKLYIEYYLMTVKIIKDIIKQDFKKQYIVEFASSLLEKEKKIKGIINIINNEAIQDKISLKIKYSDFSKNKQQVYDLMRSGFKIAVILDKSFEVNYENIEKLDMFSYVLINKDTEEYEKIEDYFKSNNNEEKYLNQVNIKIKNLIEI